MFQQYYQQLLAWWRGDLSKIVSDFEKAAKKLSDHQKYLNTIADNQAHYARDLAKRSAANYEEAAKSQAVAARLRDLIGG
jgi:hypothetical protein